MKKIVLAAVAALVAAPALAADLPRRGSAVAPAPAYAPIFTWQGFYVGAQIGYGWGKHKIAAEPITIDTDGVVGGVHAGYNLQSGSFVYGLEGDLEYGKISGPLENLLEASTKTRGSVRARLGVAVDRALIYATGGLAIAKNEYSSLQPNLPLTISKTRTGYTIGAGVEYAFTNNWSARVEYRYSDFGRATIEDTRVKVTDHVVRLGLSYRFGGPAGPILARY